MQELEIRWRKKKEGRRRKDEEGNKEVGLDM